MSISFPNAQRAQCGAGYKKESDDWLGTRFWTSDYCVSVKPFKYKWAFERVNLLFWYQENE